MLPFDLREDLIIVPTRVVGPVSELIVRLAVDTGATTTMLRRDFVATLGYNVEASIQQVQITTGSGVEIAPRITLARLETLGQERRNFSIVCHTLPPSATVDGVLGLDYFRGKRLTLDFRLGIITLD